MLYFNYLLHVTTQFHVDEPKVEFAYVWAHLCISMCRILQHLLLHCIKRLNVRYFTWRVLEHSDWGNDTGTRISTVRHSLLQFFREFSNSDT